jgi:Fe-S oxidoreductase
MEHTFISPADASVFGIPTVIFSVLIPLLGIVIFAYIMNKRIAPLLKAAPDHRLNRIPERIQQILKIWLAQYRQPRYKFAGILHIIIFFGFLTLAIRSTSLVMMGIFPGFVFPGLGGSLGHIYAVCKDYAATLVLIACIIAAIRRGIFKPARYAVPEKYGHDHTAEAIFVLGLISILMISESLFEACLVAAQRQQGLQAEFLAPATLGWFFEGMLENSSVNVLQGLHLVAYYIHDLTFFFFLCFLPLGKHFHVITSIFNVFFMRLERGNVKPVRHGVPDDKLDDLETFGVTHLEDFTWKHLLDFYTCADCGRCSDRCPANRVKRPLSPRFITIKGRDLIFKNYPLLGDAPEKKPLIGDIYSEDEIWSCTTCGACEQECPLGIEYIDKMVDLRRGMIEAGEVPQSLQKALGALEKRGNPWGKMERNRADWTKELTNGFKVKILDGKTSAETLYFVDSITSFDDRIQNIGRATARILQAAGEDFGILGKEEKDAGNEIRRFGEEMLFQDIKEQNTEAILESGVHRIITADPHTYNTLKHDYNHPDLPQVEHISQAVERYMTSGKLRLKPIEDATMVYTYHDPCYLGRHNGIYDSPRNVLDHISGIKRVEMKGNCRDRSFCCGGGGLMLFYEPEEEQRMGVVRVDMAKEAGANVIVTACPFCLVNIEDAIKVSGMEGKMEAIDLAELIDRHLLKE